MNTLNQKQVGWIAFIIAVLSFLLGIFLVPFDFPGPDINEDFGALHLAYNFATIIFMIVVGVAGIGAISGDKTFLSYFYERDKIIDTPAIIPYKRIFKWIIGIVVAIFIFSFTLTNVNKMASMYNSSQVYNNKYKAMTQEKVGFYDKMWKTYYSKDKITNINKETFLQVTKIIMENRADGEQITWKWVQENQQIPYEEFTKFYADLSNFIEAQRAGYFAIEKACQQIAASQNTLLDTFPNNLYNKVLNCKRLQFEYGFTSDQTEEVFRSKKENPK